MARKGFMPGLARGSGWRGKGGRIAKILYVITSDQPVHGGVAGSSNNSSGSNSSNIIRSKKGLENRCPP